MVKPACSEGMVSGDQNIPKKRRVLTGDDVSCKPLKVVGADPVEKWKQ